nr:DNA polymerase III subunit delta' [Desulfobulbaceae bacterium]
MTGVGKKKFAQLFAQRINCIVGEGQSCQRCPSCKKMAAGVHPDFISIEPDGAAIKINQIRELKKTLSFPP